MEKRSAGICQRPYSRALIKACGVLDSQMDKPLIAIINTWNELHPGHIHLRTLSQAARDGVLMAGGWPFETNTIALCDGIRTPVSNRNILPSREIIADSMELVAQTYQADGLILLASCDKIEPACLMAAARVNIPTVIITGGPMNPGVYHGRQLNGTDMDVAGTGYRDGKKVGEQEIGELVDSICETCGGCYGMGTANTMACLTEALGMSLPNMACTLAVETRKLRLAKESGIAVMDLVKRGIRPSDIMTKDALEDALRVNEAIGGSTNTFLHLPALAHELGIELPMEVFDRMGRSTPHLCDLQPTGRFNMTDLRNAGGMPAVMKELGRMLKTDRITVNGKTLEENLQSAETYDLRVIHSLEQPLHPYGGHAVVKGNLAPEGCVIKQIGCPDEMRRHRGPARVFDDGDEAMEAIREGQIKKGEIIVIRYEGPKGGPGMREMVDLTRLLFTMGLEKDVALVTDGRFSGYSRGAVFGHVSPEAQDRGPIAAVRDGDLVAYDVDSREITLEVSEEEINERLKGWKPKNITCGGYLRRYGKSVSSASRGAVLL